MEMSEEKKPQQVPSVGRVVHYVSHGSPDGTFKSAHRAAIITEVYADAEGVVATGIAGLCVLNPNGLYFQTSAIYDPTAQIPGTWHWPEYVPSK